MSDYKQKISIGLDGEYGGVDWEYSSEELEKLSIQDLRNLEEGLVFFIGEIERIIKEQFSKDNCFCCS